MIAVPLVLSAGSLSLMNVVDRILLTWYSTDTLAASMPAALMHWTVMSVAIGMAAYVNTFVAQYEGAGRPDRVSASTWQGIYLALGAGIILSLCVPFSSRIFELVGHAPRIQALESDYFQVLSMGSVTFLLSTVLSCFYSGRGASSVVMIVNIGSVLLNGVLDYLLIFGSGPIPELGISGAAIATVLARGAACVAFVWLIWKESGDYHFWSHRAFDPELFRRLVWHGLPQGLQYLGDIAGFSTFLFLLGGLGTRELAATNLAFTLNSLAYIPLMGLGTAVMTIVGKRVGSGKPELAVRTTWTAFWFSAALMLVFALACLLAPRLVLAPFTVHADGGELDGIHDVVIVLLRFVVVYTFFDAMAVVFSSAVRGAGDTRFSLVFTIATCWLLMVIPSYIAFRVFDAGLYAGWCAVTFYIVFLGIGFFWRFQQGKWRTMSILESGLNRQESSDIQPDREPQSDQPAVLLASRKELSE